LDTPLACEILFAVAREDVAGKLPAAAGRCAVRNDVLQTIILNGKGGILKRLQAEEVRRRQTCGPLTRHDRQIQSG
jgi:hypothetical protein